MPSLPSAPPPPVRARGTRARPRRASLLLLLVLVAGCGKRGAPLAPLPRIPGTVDPFTALRRDDEVELALVVPAANAAGDQPGDIGAVEVYAITSARPPALESGRVPSGLLMVASSPVRRPAPPAPPAGAGVAPLPRPPGLDQGERVTFRERLTPDRLRPVAETGAARPVDPSGPSLSLPVVLPPDGTGVRRHYVAVAVSRGGRRGAWSTVRSVPIGAPPSAPSAPAITYDATHLTLTWTPGPGAELPPPADAGLLEARPLGPPRPATRWTVYPADAAAASAPPLNAEPLATPTLAVDGVAFDQERCFIVRGVETTDDASVEGPASPAGCLTARDTFPPPAPAALEAVGSGGVISLIWEGVEAPDLAGYLVLRGDGGSEPTTLLTPTPIAARSYEDRGVTPGTRYVYVVVAIDSATPGNRSGPSNRAEETARQ